LNKNKSHYQGYKFNYKKGLGSWSQEELEYVIQKDGFESMLETIVLDENDKDSLDRWLGNDSNLRKEEIKAKPFNIQNI